MAKILIIGCGKIGSRLAETLSQSGHDVTGLSRNPPENNNTSSVTYYTADITVAEELNNLETDFGHPSFISLHF